MFFTQIGRGMNEQIHWFHVYGRRTYDGKKGFKKNRIHEDGTSDYNRSEITLDNDQQTIFGKEFSFTAITTILAFLHVFLKSGKTKNWVKIQYNTLRNPKKYL